MGLHFPAGDSTALAERMQRFVAEPALCKGWGEVSRERARNWTPAEGAAKWVETFQTILQA